MMHEECFIYLFIYYLVLKNVNNPIII